MVVTEGKMLTVSEAARYLNAHPNSVRRWADMGLLPSYRIGCRGDRRFKPEDVFYFLDSWQERAGPGMLTEIVDDQNLMA